MFMTTSRALELINIKYAIDEVNGTNNFWTPRIITRAIVLRTKKNSKKVVYGLGKTMKTSRKRVMNISRRRSCVIREISEKGRGLRLVQCCDMVSKLTRWAIFKCFVYEYR
jgi:hypothetical protein